MKYSATIEFTNPGEAIVALFDQAGEWSGAGRISCRSRSKADLYEIGYAHASARAELKGGTLDRYRVEEAPVRIPFSARASSCPSRLTEGWFDSGERRGNRNRLRIEESEPFPRCKEQSPDGRGLAWLASGGSHLAYGVCALGSCPRALVRLHINRSAKPAA
jgi:hypothetical protein